MAEHVHHLMQKVIVEGFSVVLLQIDVDFVVCTEEAVSESRHVEELLHHGVHVAYCSKIFDAAIAIEVSAVS